jgi:hypothetical protein
MGSGHRRSSVIGAIGALCGVGVLLAWGLGAFSDPSISIFAAAKILRAEGFHHVDVQLNAQPGAGPEFDSAVVSPSTPWPRVLVGAYVSSGAAADVLTHGCMSPAARARLPRDVCTGIPKQVRDHRVCNLLISSYSASPDPSLSGRVEDVIRRLRAMC